jgi:chromosome segregation ATPase
MVTPVELATVSIGVIGLLATGGGWLARRDTKHKNELQEEIESNEEAVDELDTAFARLTTRLFGHPDDDSDRGALTSRAERIENAEENIGSLSDEVHYAKQQAEENGEHLEHLDERVTEHAHQTRAALERIEEQLDESLIPEEGNDDFLRGGD